MIEGISPNSLVPGQDMAFKQDSNTKVKAMELNKLML